MASINGVTGGNTLVPAALPKEKLQLASSEKKTKTSVQLVEENCVGCGAVLTGKELRLAHDWHDAWTGWVQDEDEALCRHCAQVLPTAQGRGLGSCSNARDTLAKLERIREAGMLVMLETVNLGTNEGGSVQLDFGDVFKVNRVSAPISGKSDREHSMLRLTVEVNVGQARVTLWPREIAHMNLLTVLDLQRDGDYTMAFVSQEDQEGYFTLTPKGKALLVGAFGNR